MYNMWYYTNAKHCIISIRVNDQEYYYSYLIKLTCGVVILKQRKLVFMILTGEVGLKAAENSGFWQIVAIITIHF